MFTINHPFNDNLKGAELLNLDLGSDPHLDSLLDDVLDFHDRGLRTQHFNGMFMTAPSHYNHAS